MDDSIRNNQLNLLASRTGYNMALRHFRVVQEIAGSVGEGHNLADLINDVLEDGRIEAYQVRPIVNMLLVDKYGYAAKSINLQEAVTKVDKFAKIVKNWTNIQLVIVYNGSNGISLLNPDDPDAWNGELPLTLGSQCVCFALALDNGDYDLAKMAASDALVLLEGGQVKNNARYRSSENVKRRFTKADTLPPAPPTVTNTATGTPNETPMATIAQPASGQSKKLTAKIGVNVTNELFHNGNVEAWKRIIQSYKAKYPSLDVLVWYDGEKINDLNSLFKWGKVKHGTPIMFSVAGDAPVGLAKLRKYLFEGASSRFEAFLHGSPGSVLSLF